MPDIHQSWKPLGPTATADDAQDWRDSGACLDEDPELFFPVGHGLEAVMQADDAKAVCRRCPVVMTCLEWALETRQPYGVWGGLDERQRFNVLRRRTALRPAERKAADTQSSTVPAA